MYLFMSLYGLIDYYFTQWVLLLSVFFFNAQVVPDLAGGSLFEVVLMSF